MAPAIQATQLTRRFGARTVVNQIDLSVEPGEIFGFLGPNGAGKTTTISMLTGILAPSSGGCLILGQPMNARALELKTRIGVVAQHQSVYGNMTLQEYLNFFAALYRIPTALAKQRIGGLLEALDLEGAAAEPG